MKRKIGIDENVNNTELIIALKIMQETPSRESQSEFINKMIHARFLSPAVLDPEPEKNENGEYEFPEGTKIMFNSVSNPQKQMYLVAYTDAKEAAKNKQDEKQHSIVTTYPDLCNMLLKTESPYAGFVINPFSENVIVTKEMMADINKNIRITKKKTVSDNDILQ